ncbi:MAG: cytochrome C oxidase subunit II [Myxococcota bacterium]
MIERYLEQVSTYAGDIDGLINLIAWFVGVWFLVAEFVFFYLIFKFRHREGHKGEYITGEEKHQKRFITIPHFLVLVCDIFIIIGAVRVWVDVKQTLPPADATVRIIGQQWAWSFVHPGPDGELDTADDIKTVESLNTEVGKVYHFQLESRDVLHDFSVPVFRLKQDAIPGRIISGWWKATKTGEWDIQCAEICGIGHGVMRARIKVQSAAEHASWMHENSPVASIASAN